MAQVPADLPSGEFEVAGETYRLQADADGPCLRRRIQRAEWNPTGRPGGWVFRLHVQGIGRAPDGQLPLTLRAEGRTLEALDRFLPEDLGTIPAGSYKAHGERLYLQLAPEEEPPEECELAISVRQEAYADGLHRVHGRRFTGNGFASWPGSKRRLSVDLPAASRLSFVTTAESIQPNPVGDAGVVFRVHLDDELLFEHSQEVNASGSSAWHTVALPAQGREDASLWLSVEGDASYCAFLAPMVSPVEKGVRGGRPWAGSRPDLTIFLADTFRADNMTTYGGELELTPNLDALAKESLVFRRAWSVSTHTLPAHGSLFTGLFPRQTGIMDHGTRIASELETLAEFFSAQGYRTGAITDAAVVSQYFGMAQGFEWFDEYRAPEDDIGSTIARTREFLAMDDGRPTLLFVHSYRAHTPYRVTDETRKTWAEELGIEGEYEHWDRIWNKAPADGRASLKSAPHREALEKLRAFYRGGASDVDRGFAQLLEVLRAEGALSQGYLVFTSDHGEAFGEHNDAWHSGAVFDEQSRIPLLVHGPGIEAGGVDWAASLVDLPPTLARLAGVRQPEAWLGTSLVDLDRERPVFLFQCRRDGGLSTWGVVDQGRKLIGFEEQQELREGIAGAFDLEHDPLELEDVQESAAWPQALLRVYGETVGLLLVPVAGSQRVNLDDSHRAQLEELGYGG